MTPTAEEIGILQGLFQSVGGIVAAVVVLVVVVGIAGIIVYFMVSRSGTPQGDLARTLVGRTGTAVTPVSRAGGRVEVDGENIRALSEAELKEGSEIRVIEVEGLIAKVVPASEPWPPATGREETQFGAPPDFDSVESEEEAARDD